MDQRARAFGQSLVSRIDREPHGKPNIESTSPNDRQAALVDRGASRERLYRPDLRIGVPWRSPTARAIVVAPAGRGASRIAPSRTPCWACANNERPPSKPHSPVGRAVHAGRCRRHDRLGHRRCANGSPVAGASARITEMTHGPRRRAQIRQTQGAGAGGTVHRRGFCRASSPIPARGARDGAGVGHVKSTP
jgi:hypothetical protein